jgi:two-component system chemotaxis response regulator CheB
VRGYFRVNNLKPTIYQKSAITIAQDEESAVIYGMPGEAIRLDAATYVFSPDKIATVLASLVKKS